MDELAAFRAAKDGTPCPHAEEADTTLPYTYTLSAAGLPGVFLGSSCNSGNTATVTCGKRLVFVKGRGLVCPEHGLQVALD